MDYKIYHYTNPNRKDSSRINGDYSLWKQLENGLVYLVVADGVGSTDKHWVASKMVCELSLESFIENEMNFKDIPQRLSYAIEKANKEIFAQGAGSLSTLCVGIFDNKNKDFFYTWLGDSRIYKIGNTLEQLTSDQRGTQLVRLNEEPLVEHGSVNFRPVITNAIGYENIVFEINQINIKDGESILLVTDGFYETITIEESFQQIINKRNFEYLFEQHCRQIGDENYDDATILILKIFDNQQDNTSNLLEEIISLFDASNRIDLINSLQKLEDITLNDFKLIMEKFSQALNYKNDSEVYQKIMGLRRFLK